MSENNNDSNAFGKIRKYIAKPLQRCYNETVKKDYPKDISAFLG